jgi:hypothetical protein
MAYSLSFSKLKLEMPPCVQDFVNNYVNDSIGEDGFLHMRNAYSDVIDQSIKSNEIEADLPIKEYIFDYEKLDTCSDTLPVEELIRPTGLWILPVKARGKYIYEVLIKKTNDSCTIIGSRSLNYDLFWGDLRKKYPSSKGENPVLIIDGTSKYLHFPKRGARNLYFLDPNNFSGKSATHDLAVKNDGNKVIASIKKNYKNAKPSRDEIERIHPGIYKKMRNCGGEE